MGERTYLIRYGVMAEVGRFITLPACDALFERGDVVVIQSHRGLELGEVLIPHDSPAPALGGGDHRPVGGTGQNFSPTPAIDLEHVLRLAGPEDLARSRSAQETRMSLLALCQRVLEDGNWPCELIDVEPLLDGCATVLHYLGPHQLDVGSVRSRFRVAHGLEVILQPVGTEVDGTEAQEHAHHSGDQTGCGSCDCGAGGGCGGAAASRTNRGTHSTASGTNGSNPAPHAGCASCGISLMLAARDRKDAKAR